MYIKKTQTISILLYFLFIFYLFPAFTGRSDHPSLHCKWAQGTDSGQNYQGNAGDFYPQSMGFSYVCLSWQKGGEGQVGAGTGSLNIRRNQETRTSLTSFSLSL